MQRSGRRLLYSSQYVAGFASALRQARAELAQLNFDFQCQVADLRRELDEVRAAYAELRAIALARARAEAELAALYRERSIARARAAERDPLTPLQ